MSKSGQNREPAASAPIAGELLGADEGPRTVTPAGHLDIIRMLSRLTDTAFEIPGLGWRFGLDPIIGLIPVVGDVATSLMSLYILSVAQHMQVPRSTLMRMGLNVAVDYVVGSIPFLGNLFDFAWKANDKNLKILERSLAAGPRERTQQTIWDWLFVGGLIALLIAVFIGSLALAIFLASWLLEAIRSP